METLQFNNLFQEHAIALMLFAKKLTKNAMDAEDLVQETAIKAFKSMHSFNQGTNFKSWAFTILKNTFITGYHKNRKKAVINAPIEDFSFALQSNYATRNDAVSHLRIQDIISCIDTLSYKVKMPFLMHVKGYQYNEIAESLNIPIGTVKSRINYARTKIKSELEAKSLTA